MNNKILYKVFIWTFIVLYAGTAFISYCHSIEFFNIGNENWMSYILGAIFELGQATVLASLLLTNNKKTLLPWLLMILLTAVQVIGNTYSVFKFMSLSENNYYIKGEVEIFLLPFFLTKAPDDLRPHGSGRRLQGRRPPSARPRLQPRRPEQPRGRHADP